MPRKSNVVPIKSKEEKSNALLAAPESLSSSKKVIWDYAIKCAPKGLLTKIDSGVLEIYVTAVDAYDEAKKMVDLEGQVITSPNGHLIQSPYMAILNKQAFLILKTAAVLGFTPVSRTRLDIEPELDPDDPWADFMKSR
jgi:P27 family predicted phage terminase small subunit